MSVQALLSGVADVLRLPVLAATFVALAVAAWEAGRFAVELHRRRNARPVLAGALQAATVHRALPQATRALLPPATARAAAALLADDPADPERHEAALAAFELAAQRRLEPARLLVRVGPALGLMGTLIPLAPGLGAVAAGDVATLAGELRTAFAATVLGLAVGTAGFVIALVRARIYAEDLDALEQLARQIRERRCGA